MKTETSVSGMRLLTFFALSIVLSGPLACDRNGSAAPTRPKKAPVPVVVAQASEADVPVELPALGAVEPVQSTPIRAQIGGTITEVKVREGAQVSAGQVLFQIDPRPYEAILRQLVANLSRDEAQVKNAEAQVRNGEAQVRNAEAQAANAESQLKRYEDLIRKDFVTREQYDQRATNADTARAGVSAARAALDAAKAQVDSARATADATRAGIENARLQLGYTMIRSPVSGQAGSLQLKQGDLAKANDVPLVTINQIQPILIRFAVPEPSLPEVRRRSQTGEIRVRVIPSGESKPREGRLIFIDNAVDTSTGTIVLKAQFDNRDAALWPGQFIDVTLVLHTRAKAVVIPAAAVQTGQQGPYVYVVGDDGAATVRPVKPGVAAGAMLSIDDGLKVGETVVTDGQLRLTPGAKVVPKGAEARPGPKSGRRPGGDATEEKAVPPQKVKGQRT